MHDLVLIFLKPSVVIGMTEISTKPLNNPGLPHGFRLVLSALPRTLKELLLYHSIFSEHPAWQVTSYSVTLRENLRLSNL